MIVYLSIKDFHVRDETVLASSSSSSSSSFPFSSEGNRALTVLAVTVQLARQ